jgi:hypothetical protein
MDVLAAIENSGFAVWVRESGTLLSYPAILFMHTLGLALLVGPNLVVDLCMLSVGRVVPLAATERFFQVMWIGFWMNAASGAALLIADASTKLINPVFYVKIVFIAAGVVTMVLMRRRIFGRPLGERLILSDKALAWISVSCWMGAITAGRLMAYIGPVSGAPDLNNTF